MSETPSDLSADHQPKKIVHFWGGYDASGNCIPECRARDTIPERIDANREQWSIMSREVTCTKCLCIRGLQGLKTALDERGIK